MFTLTPTDNAIAESDETITISSSSVLVSNSATLTLRDDDSGATVMLSVSPQSVGEGEGATTVTVTATSSGTLTDVQVLPITVTGSGALGAVDFASVADFNLTLAANTTTASTTFTLTPTDDQVDEADETITIGSSSTLVVQSATVTLVDNDITPGITLSASPTTIVEGDGPTTVTVTGRVTGGTTFGAAQSAALTVAGSGNASVVGFTPVTGVILPVAAEAASGKITFTLTPTDNQVQEANESVLISSSSALVSNTASITLYDDDGTPTITLTVSPASVREGAGATVITVTATSTGPFTDSQALPITVAGSGASGAVDFAAVPGFDLTLAGGETAATASFTLTPTDDQVDEADETITIRSTSALVVQSATLTLTDDDATPQIALSVFPTVVSEGDGDTTVAVTGTVTGGTTYGTAQSIALTIASSGIPGAVGFTPVTGLLLPVAAQATTGITTFILSPTDNNDQDTDETITIRSSSPLVSNTATITLYDNDGGAPVTLSVSPASIYEGDGSTLVTVYRTQYDLIYR